MGIVGILLAVGIIGGVTALQRDFLPTTSISSANNSLTSKSNPQSSAPDTGLLAVQLTDPPNVPNGVTDVFINYSEIDVHIASVGLASGWYAVANSSNVDLMSLVNVSVTLGSAPVSSGVFNLVRFDINSATVTFLGKNYTARVPSNHLTIPIFSGGIRIAANASAGVLIDFSPTVVPLWNKSTAGFILVPVAKGFPIPGQYWSPSLVQRGERDNRHWWSSFETNAGTAVSIQSARLSPNFLRVVVKNTGNESVTLTGIAVSANISVPNSSTSLTLNPGSHFIQINSDVMIAQNTASDDYYGKLRTIATFAILSNGSLVQPSAGLEIPQSSLGFVMAPGQTQTFVYSSNIATLNIAEILSGAIVPGVQYVISVLGAFGSPAYANVNAT